MPKYLFQATYTAEGLEGLAKDTATGRKAAIQSAVKAVKGKLEAFYFAFGADDVVLIVDLPDNATAAAFAMSASVSGQVSVITTPLLTPQEVDEALKMPNRYKAPGTAK